MSTSTARHSFIPEAPGSRPADIVARPGVALPEP